MDEFSMFNQLAKNTVTLSEGEEWKRHTRVTASALSKFANKATFEVKIQELIDRTESYIADTKGKPHNFHLIIANLASNIILQFNCSRDYEITDFEFKRIRHTSWQLAIAFQYINFILTGPVFELMMKFKPHLMKLAKDSWAELEDITESITWQRLRTYKPTDCNDALDAMIKEYRTPDDQCDVKFVKKNLAGAIFSGIDTTAAIMNYIQLFVTFVRLMRRFEWSLPDGVTVTIPATMRGNLEFIFKPFEVCAKDRS
ncbi:cytochrome P450 2J2-like isoform X1 [Leptotrombidium deliense]|uniref:Cytochrome P450 2J2-like isoform X1 n=1 Tax=Leptotrombidium deliense TaxID=299467 RepID=A0A443SB44_9ACAR|nr:cytochrome P450 2J2-like isoform X1 [Leptotrombidium deliense]